VEVRMIKDLKEQKVKIHNTAFVADSADVIGDVIIGENSSIWYGAVVRGDIENIEIGKYTNIQDNAVVHTETNIPTKIGDYCVIGHNAIIHGCTIGNNTLIGMGAIILNRAVIGNNCIIGAGTVVTEGKIIPDNSMVIGIPGKVVRMVTEEEITLVKDNAIRYTKLYKKHID